MKKVELTVRIRQRLTNEPFYPSSVRDAVARAIERATIHEPEVEVTRVVEEARCANCRDPHPVATLYETHNVCLVAAILAVATEYYAEALDQATVDRVIETIDVDALWDSYLSSAVDMIHDAIAETGDSLDDQS